MPPIPSSGGEILNAARRLVAVHAHPDDECLTTGGSLARYAAEGVHTCLVTCTSGELGEIADVPGIGSPDEIRPRLAEIRTDELREACRVLGVRDLRLLGYHDSGMDGEPTTLDPKAFVNQDLEEIAGRIVAILREVRPQVVVTYNEYGFYGHPDHIQAHRATVAAVQAAGDPSRYPDLGQPYEVPKLYYTAVPKGRMRRLREMFAEQAPAEVEERFSDEQIELIGTDDDAISTEIDVGGFVALKFAALEAHRTQLGTTEGFLSIPEEVRPLVMGLEHYVLARSTVPRDGLERDLFEGIA